MICSHAMERNQVIEEKDRMIQRADEEIQQQKAIIEDKNYAIYVLQIDTCDLADNLTQANLYTEEVSKKRKQFEDEVETEIMALKKTHFELSEQAKLKVEEDIRSLNAEHEAIFAAEKGRARSLESDLEEERLKRRRADRESKVHREEAQRYKSQLTCSSGAGGGANGGDIDSALREIKAMSQQLDEKNIEIAALKTGSGGAGSGGKGAKKELAGGYETRSSTTSASSSNGPQRIKNDSSTYCSGFMEHGDLSDKKIEQLTREKRELISKNLEENKEKMEISQKLIVSENENASLKSKLTKLTLEKERVERKMAMHKEKEQKQKAAAIENSGGNVGFENIVTPFDL